MKNFETIKNKFEDKTVQKEQYELINEISSEVQEDDLYSDENKQCFIAFDDINLDAFNFYMLR